jgi:hypothetical protein
MMKSNDAVGWSSKRARVWDADHPAVGHHDEPAEAEALPEPREQGQEGGDIPRAPGQDVPRDRPAVPIHGHARHHLQQIRAAIPRVPPPAERGLLRPVEVLLCLLALIRPGLEPVARRGRAKTGGVSEWDAGAAAAARGLAGAEPARLCAAGAAAQGYRGAPENGTRLPERFDLLVNRSRGRQGGSSLS